MAKGKSEPVPEFTSDRLRLLAPLITPAAIELARNRVLHDRDRIDESEADKDTRRIALILVREMNPWASLTDAEEGILRGLNRKTVGKLQREGDL